MEQNSEFSINICKSISELFSQIIVRARESVNEGTTNMRLNFRKTQSLSDKIKQVSLMPMKIGVKEALLPQLPQAIQWVQRKDVQPIMYTGSKCSQAPVLLYFRGFSSSNRDGSQRLSHQTSQPYSSKTIVDRQHHTITVQTISLARTSHLSLQ